MKFTDQEIQEAKRRTRYSTRVGHHQHPDSIRCAAAWLDAQRRTKRPTQTWHDLKHIIEEWCGFYTSVNDIEVAAVLLGIKGRYPYYPIDARLVRPDLSRLDGIGQAMAHEDYCRRNWHGRVYSTVEPAPVAVEGGGK